ncbi:MAG: hypothetical protein WD448_00815 [Woeseia sp.]
MNSERIERKFGNFGIEIIERSAERRISSLYSLVAGRRVCRTYATVKFCLPVAPELAREHALVLGGDSIGAVFKEHEWIINKRPLSVSRLDLATADCIAQAMRLSAPTRVALQRYVFTVTKNGSTFEYAAITEIHHPEHLTERDLEAEKPGTCSVGERY